MCVFNNFDFSLSIGPLFLGYNSKQFLMLSRVYVCMLEYIHVCVCERVYHFSKCAKIPSLHHLLPDTCVSQQAFTIFQFHSIPLQLFPVFNSFFCLYLFALSKSTLIPSVPPPYSFRLLTVCELNVKFRKTYMCVCV